MRQKPIIIVAFAFSLLLAAPGFARAEWFGDVYVGGAFTQDDDISVSLSGITATGTAEFDDSFVFGGRAGYWFPSVPTVGLALDLSYFQPADELDVIPLSALFLFRFTFDAGADVSKAPFQPYVAVGPGLFFSEVDEDLRPFFNASYKDDQVDIGLDLRAGMVWKLTDQIGLFVEYRYTYFSPDYKDSVLGVSTSASVDIQTHHVNVGFRF